MNPTAKGVWWMNDDRWERYSPVDAHKIMEAWRNGETNLSLGPLKSFGRHPAPLYFIDLATMRQTDTNSGLSRNIKIIPGPEDNQKGRSDEDFFGEISHVRQTAVTPIEKDKSVVKMIPSVTVDLQKLSTQCRMQDHCNLVLKLPKAFAQTDSRLTSLRSKILSLLLEKLSSGDFIENLLREKWPVWLKGGGFDRLESYKLGQAYASARYGAFLTYLCALAEEEEDVVDRLFRVAEQGYTAEGDPVEYLYTTVPDSASDYVLQSAVLPVGCGLLSRTPPARKQLRKEKWMVVCLGISKYLQEQRVATRTPGTVIPVGLMCDPAQIRFVVF